MKILNLKSDDQLEQLLKPDAPTVLIFKHSTRCSISRMVWDRLQRGWTDSVRELPVYYLDLLNFRSISNRIASELQVPHESPQVLLLYNGRCVWHASHTEISVLGITEGVQKFS
jgi:bacillithiol system protein YtxJ